MLAEPQEKPQLVTEAKPAEETKHKKRKIKKVKKASSNKQEEREHESSLDVSGNN